jgi:hypothetical protein
VQNMKELTKFFLELIRDYSKVVGCKVNIQMSPYSNNEQIEFELRNAVPLTLVSLKWNTWMYI